MPTWKDAQGEVLGLLVDVRKLVDARDESGVLELINQQDAFCEQAKAEQAKEPNREAESPCHFCQGHIQSGGCLERLDAIDHAVLHGEWEDADRLVQEYHDWVKNLKVD